jgi:hypothetical protein
VRSELGGLRLIPRLPHLTRRFVGALTARRDADDFATLDRYLGRGEQALFLTMTLADQRHSLDLSARLRADGHDEPDLVRAALLHDVGKALGPLPLPYRVIHSLAAIAAPRLACWLGQDPAPSWRRPFYFAAHHAALGAEAAARAGSNSRVVRLIGGHDQPGPDELAQLLYRYDRHM